MWDFGPPPPVYIKAPQIGYCPTNRPPHLGKRILEFRRCRICGETAAERSITTSRQMMFPNCCGKRSCGPANRKAFYLFKRCWCCGDEERVARPTPDTPSAWESCFKCGNPWAGTMVTLWREWLGKKKGYSEEEVDMEELEMRRRWDNRNPGEGLVQCGFGGGNVRGVKA